MIVYILFVHKKICFKEKRLYYFHKKLNNYEKHKKNTKKPNKNISSGLFQVVFLVFWVGFLLPTLPGSARRSARPSGCPAASA
jgi:hypothetical protein